MDEPSWPEVVGEVLLFGSLTGGDSMRTFCIGLFLLYGTTAYADDILEIQKKNSFLTLSAFECSAVSPNKEEQLRLFNLGLQAGRDFIRFWEAHPDSRESLGPKTPMLWKLVRGPTPDFILGQVYRGRVDEVYKEMPHDGEPQLRMELWDSIQAKMYQEKNCAFLGK